MYTFIDVDKKTQNKPRFIGKVSLNSKQNLECSYDMESNCNLRLEL